MPKKRFTNSFRIAPHVFPKTFQPSPDMNVHCKHTNTLLTEKLKFMKCEQVKSAIS